VRFTTWTLRYHEMEWLKIDALERHWRARISMRAVVAAMRHVRIQTKIHRGLHHSRCRPPRRASTTQPPRASS
jgi:hypothetical protein